MDDDFRARITAIVLGFADPANPQWVSAKGVDIADGLIAAMGWTQELADHDGVLEHRFVTGWRRDG